MPSFRAVKSHSLPRVFARPEPVDGSREAAQTPVFRKLYGRSCFTMTADASEMSNGISPWKSCVAVPGS